jgi:hypothetical protein
MTNNSDSLQSYRQRGRTFLHFTCEHCSKEFSRPKRGRPSAHSFCSRECYWKSDYRSALVAGRNRKRNPEAQQTRPCATCGVDVTRYVSTGQQQFFCSRECRWENHKHVKRTNAAGYVLVYVGHDYPGATKTGHIFEHRKVMQDLLGRALLPAENVHHKNGIKDDNRPENLELWTRSQPQGQRVEDKIRWAQEFLALYET